MAFGKKMVAVRKCAYNTGLDVILFAFQMETGEKISFELFCLLYKCPMESLVESKYSDVK